MTSRPETLLRLPAVLGAAVALAVAASGCTLGGGGGGGGAGGGAAGGGEGAAGGMEVMKPPQLDPARCTLTVDRSAGVVADGVDRATVTVTLKNDRGEPMADQQVTLEVSGTQNTLTPPPLTDANGKAVALLSSTKAESKMLHAAVDGTPLPASATVKFTAGAAAKLAFFVQPSSAATGSPIAPAVQVAVVDGSGNVVTDAEAMVSIALGSNATGAALLGTRSAATVAGFALFDDLSIDKLGQGYTLIASAAGLPQATSAAFNVTAGPPAKLVFTVHPSSSTAGAALSPAVEVTVQDRFGNAVRSATDAVTLELSGNPGAATLSGTLSAPAQNGVASFSTLSVDKAGQGYTLVARAAGLTSATSAAFNVVAGPAARLAFTVQPSNGAVGVDLSPSVAVAVQDALGNRVVGATAAVSLALGQNPASATLTGGAATTPAQGVAEFPTLRLSQAGSGFTLVASAQGLASATSQPFDVAIVSGARLVFTTQPADVTAGATMTPAVQVTMQDASGNVVTSFSGTVTIGLAANSAGAVLLGTTTVGASAGVASFPDLSLEKIGTGFTLRTNAAAGATPATSAAFKVTAATPQRLAFVTQPTTVAAGASLAPAVQVAVQDAFGNLVAGATNSVSVALDTNSGGAALTGAAPASPVGGVASFSALKLDKTGTGYTLRANATGLASAISMPFAVTPGAASRLAFVTHPTAAVAGAAIAPAVEVAVQDAFGNTVTSSTDAVAVALAQNPGGATLSGTRTVTAVAGVATFADLSLEKAALGYTLTASRAGLTSGSSVAFDITPAAPARLAFTTQPVTSPASVPMPAVRVAVQDAFGNVVTAAGAPVVLALGANPGPGLLTGTLSVAPVDGTASFTTLTIDRPATGYTLVATSGSLTPATSAAFEVTAGPPAQLTFAAQPHDAIAGAALAPAVTARIEDRFGNLVLTATDTVTVALGQNPGMGALSGQTTAAAVGGVATFSTLSVDKAASGYTLRASSGALTAATSSTFAISAGPAARLAFVDLPTSAVAGAAFAPVVQVGLLDAFGNPASGAPLVSLAIASGPAGAALSGTAQVSAAMGVARFPGLSLDKAGSYTLSASASGVSSATSSSFTVTAGAPASLSFSAQPHDVAAGAAISPAVQVTVRDAYGNLASSSAPVTLALGPAANGGTLAGSASAAVSAGVATFSGLSVNKAGQGYTLAASLTGASGATSAAFAVTAGPATRLTFVTQPPATSRADTALAPTVRVQLLDAFDNVASSSTATVSLGLGPNAFAASVSAASVAASGGVASFPALSVDRAGAGYTLIASAPGLTSVTSSAFDISAPWSQVLSKGTVNAFAVHPTSPQTLWAATGGGVFKSTDGAGRWALASSGLTKLDVRALAVDSAAPATLYAGTADGALFKSTDGAGSWQGLTFTGGRVVAIAVAPTPMSSTLWVAAANGVYRSQDGGATFTALSVNGTAGSAPMALAVDASSAQTVYVALPASPPSSAQLYKTTNGGGAWSSLPGATVSPSATVTGVAASGQTVWVTSTFGVLSSSNGGASFSTASSIGATAVTLDAAGIAFVGTPTGVFSSSAGSLVQVSFTGLSNPPVSAVAADPVTAGTVYAGATGAWKKVTTGTAFTEASVGLVSAQVRLLAAGSMTVSPNPMVLAATSQGLWRSTDSGATWVPASTSPILAAGLLQATALVISGTAGGALGAGWAATPSGLFASPDGLSWQPAPLPPNAGVPLSLATSASGQVYVGTSFGQIYVGSGSAVGGGSFTALPPVGFGGAGGVTALAWSSGALFAGTAAGVFVEFGVGGSWQLALSGPVRSLAADSALGNGPVFAVVGGAPGNTAGLYRGLGSGSFSPVQGPSAGLDVRSVCAVGGVAYVGTTGAGVYTLDPGASLLRPANVGLSNLTALSVVALSPAVVLAGTDGRGLFRSLTGGQ